MKHPHPWLARVARVGIVLGVSAWLAATGATLLYQGEWGLGYFRQRLDAWRWVTTATVQPSFASARSVP